MKRRDFMKISVGGAVAMSSLNAKENNAGERVEKPKVPFANPSKEAAANAAKNPFGLVYGDAISKNEAGKVNLTPVSYKSRGLDIAANVYTPANFDPNKSYAAVVVAHPNGGVKEQVAGLYAQRLAGLATSRSPLTRLIRALAGACRATSIRLQTGSRISARQPIFCLNLKA